MLPAAITVSRATALRPGSRSFRVAMPPPVSYKARKLETQRETQAQNSHVV